MTDILPDSFPDDFAAGADRLEATLYSPAGPDGLFALQRALARLWPGGVVREVLWRRTRTDERVALRAFDAAGRLIGHVDCGLDAFEKRQASHV